MKKEEIVSTTQFYNTIAGEYDKHLASPKDVTVREEIASFFKKTVPAGLILDFGGGTGLDLSWLIEGGYKVFFCEPAENMKNQAIVISNRYAEEVRPHFLEKSDFRLWQQNNLPFEGKVKAVLANFGVLNYIEDLPLLFEKLSFLLDNRGSVVVNLLYASPARLLSRYFKNTVKALLRGEKIKTGSQYKGLVHEATLYSIRDIEKAAEKYFVLEERKKIGKKSDFILLHLVKI